MIFCLGICHKDIAQAERWLSFVFRMNKGERPNQPTLIAVATKSAQRAGLLIIQRLGFPVYILEDEDESGYPKSASHLFLRSLEYCERAHPGEPVFWLEPDTLPMRPNWREEIAAEYATCGKPFMGQIERGHGFAHLCGCAIYPPDWRVRAPLLASVLTAPDIFWGKGLGQAFDTWAAPETVPQTHECLTFQQIWRPPLPITREWLRKNVRQGAALMHQCKDGSGFKAVREMQKL
jgi:hypothetical protein